MRSSERDALDFERFEIGGGVGRVEAGLVEEHLHTPRGHLRNLRSGNAPFFGGLLPQIGAVDRPTTALTSVAAGSKFQRIFSVINQRSWLL